MKPSLIVVSFCLASIVASATSFAGDPEPFGKPGGKYAVPITGNVGIIGTPDVKIVSLPPVTLSSATGITVKNSDAASYFSVPFFTESNNIANPGRLWVVLTLAKPAIFDSYFGSCNGPTDSGLLQFDGGPKALNNTTGAGKDANTAVVLGSNIILNQAPIPFVTNTTSNGTNYILPPTHMGIPIASDIELLIFPKGASFIQCEITFIFKSID